MRIMLKYDDECRLAERVIAKEREAENLFVQHYDNIIQYVLATQYHIRNRQDLEEVKQDVFVALFQNMEKWLSDNPDRQTLMSYVGAITRNHACSFLRHWYAKMRDRSAVSSIGDVLTNKLVSKEASPDAMVIAKDMVDKLMLQSTQGQRKILTLLLAGMSEIEIAEHLNITRSGVSLYMQTIRQDAVRLKFIDETTYKQGARYCGCQA